jgi:hypothetical protein
VIYSWDGGASYECVYSTGAGSPQSRGAALATAPHPLGPWTKERELIPRSDQVENPRILYDPARGVWYLLTNHIGKDSLGEHTVSHVLYWSTDRRTWSVLNKTLALEPDAGAWDDYTIGLPSTEVVRDGVLYLAYDGKTLANFNPHKDRDIGIAEARFPFAWGDSVRVSAGSSVRASAFLVGDGTAKVRVKLQASGDANVPCIVSLRSAQHTYDAGMMGRLMELYEGWWENVFSPGVLIDGTYSASDGTVASGTLEISSQERYTAQTKTIEFVRSGASMTIRFSGLTIWTGACDTAPLDLYADGDLQIEEAWVVSSPAQATLVLPVDFSATNSVIPSFSATIKVTMPAIVRDFNVSAGAAGTTGFALQSLVYSDATDSITTTLGLTNYLGQTEAPAIFGIAPSPVQPTTTSITVSGIGPLASIMEIGASPAAVASSTANLTSRMPMTATCAAVASSTASLPLRSLAPTLTALTPGTVTAGQNFTVSGGGLLMGAVGAVFSGATANLVPIISLSATVASRANSTAGITHPIVLPATLNASDAETMTASPSGNNILFDAGEWVEYRVDAGPGGSFSTDTLFTNTVAGSIEYSVDGAAYAPMATLIGDPITGFDEEEGEPMPAHYAYETLITCQPGVETRLDTAVPSNRVEVVMVNTDANVRLAYARVSPSNAAAPTITVGAGPTYATDRQVIEADYGTPTRERADNNIAFYGKPMGATAVVVRVIQYATA